MAIRCTKSICSLGRSSWNLHSIAVAHRLGPVPVGHTSVFIVVSAVHRAKALDVCKFLIDEINASVPIWKKEVYVNGEVWKENSEFLERRIQIVEGNGVCSERKKGCCAVKVKRNSLISSWNLECLICINPTAFFLLCIYLLDVYKVAHDVKAEKFASISGIPITEIGISLNWRGRIYLVWVGDGEFLWIRDENFFGFQ
ncbi:hypothetical protein ACSBR1_038097 [Camellia fascicularis]